MSALLADIDATCAALGYNDGEKYFAEPDAIQGLKHLIWILRRDLDNHEYRRHLGRAKVLQTDLVPMLINYIDNDEYSDVLIRLLIILTNPILLLYRDGIPKDGNGRKIYLELIDILQNYKTAFSADIFWSVLTLRLHKVLEVDWALRSEEQNLLIERILVLARNVLQVPSNPDIECRADNDASLHDQIIWALHQSGMLDLILYVLSSTNENQYHLHALEIICLLYREQTAESLADASLQRSFAEKYRDEQELVAARKREKQKNILKLPQGRHSRFGGTYVLRNVKSVSEKDIICHQSLERAVSLDFDREKSKQKRSHRFVSEENVIERRSAFSVRLCLREYCIEVLRSGYNTLVRQVRRVLEHSTGSSSQDDSYLLWAIRFFMEFNRLSGLQLDLVSESLSVQCFHWVLMRIDHHMDMMRSDKKQARLWSKRLHIAIQTFRELLLSLIALQKLKDEKALALFDMLQNNVCYVLEYREMILHLLMNYNETHSTKAYLRDVVETANIFIKIMEKFCKDPVLVQDKRRQRRKNNKNGKKSSSSKTKKSQQNMNTNENENLEDKWAGLASEIASTLTQDIQLPEESQPIPFDAASDKSIDNQKDDCMLRIYKFLREENFEKAIVLMRSAREVWPENDCFGKISSSPEDELMLLREIYLSDLGPVEKKSAKNDEGNDDEQNNEEEGYYNDDEENEEEENVIVEKDFRFEDFAKRLVNPKVVRACTLVLTDWEKISTKSLKSAVTILHRIAFGCKCSAMLYQATLFRIFQQVFHAPKDDHHEELRRLGIYIVRNFTETAPNNPKIYAELLFYKTLKEANDIETGYTDDYNTNYKGSWSEEQENELRMLFEENQKNPENDKDVIDWILDNLIDKTRTRRVVMKKLREMGLIFKAPTKKTNATAAKKILWKYEEDEQLRSLYDEFRLQPDCLNKILEVLRDKHSKNNIIKRMISLGLIADKSEILPNKKISRNRKTQNIGSHHNEGNSDNDDDDNDGYTIQQQDTFMDNTRKNNKKGQKNNNRKSKNKINITKKNKRTNVKTPLHVGSVKNLLDQIDEQFKEAINWLKDCLNDAAEDLKDNELPDDEDDGVPLVPLLDIQREAMDNEQFKKILITLGIQPPITEMENYWRIPIYLNAADLNMRVQLLNGTYEGSGEDGNDNDDGNIEKGNYDFNDNDSDDGSDDDNSENDDEDEDDTDNNISSSSDEEIDLHENIMNKRREQFDNLVFNRSDDEDEYREPLKARENSQSSSNMKTKKQDKITNINQSKNKKILNKENSNSKKKHGKFNIDDMIKTTQNVNVDDDDNFSSQNLRLRLAELTGDTDESDVEDQNAIEQMEILSSASSSTKTTTRKKVNSFIHSRIRRNIIDSDSSDEDKGINDDDDDNNENDSIAKKKSMNETNNLLQYPVINTGIEIMQSNDENELNDNVSQVKKHKIYQIDSDSKSKVSNKRNRSEDGEQEISDDDDDEDVVIIKKKKITNVNDTTIRQRKRIAVIDDDDDDEVDKDDNGSVAAATTSGGAGDDNNGDDDDDDNDENGRKNIDKMILMEDDE